MGSSHLKKQFTISMEIENWFFACLVFTRL